VGTASEPVDVQAWDLDVQGQVTRDIDFGGNDATNVGALGVGSVDVDEIGNGGSPVSLNDILDFVEGATGDSFQLYESKVDGTTVGGRYVQFTSGVSTTDVTILDVSAETTFVGAMAIVIGENDSNSSERFTDAVLFTRKGDATVLGQSEQGSPATRSYSVFESTLELSVSSNAYSILAIGDGGRSTV
ncbi:MAG: hypothetical protein RI560_08025, partial [Natronomonas sp.]|nr:hypothetical protein [Natronomonas sp.]